MVVGGAVFFVFADSRVPLLLWADIADGSSGVRVLGRRVNVLRALSRDDASNAAAGRKTKVWPQSIVREEEGL